jgi:hypothetical protein
MHVVHPPRKKRNMRIRVTVGPARSKMLAVLRLQSGAGPHRDKRRPARVNQRGEWRREIRN